MNKEIITKSISLEDAKSLLGIDNWSVWECEPSEFDWFYSDTETAYVFEGDVIVTADAGISTHITPGMLVTFPKGLNCIWKVNKKIRKCYKFGD